MLRGAGIINERQGAVDDAQRMGGDGKANNCSRRQAVLAVRAQRPSAIFVWLSCQLAAFDHSIEQGTIAHRPLPRAIPVLFLFLFVLHGRHSAVLSHLAYAPQCAPATAFVSGRRAARSALAPPASFRAFSIASASNEIKNLINGTCSRCTDPHFRCP